MREAVNMLTINAQIPGIPDGLLTAFMQQEPSVNLELLKINFSKILSAKQVGNYVLLALSITSIWQLALLNNPQEFISCSDIDYQMRDSLGRNIIHYLCILGLTICLEQCQNIPNDILAATDNNGANLLHFSALSGSPAAIEYILEFDPEFFAVHWDRKNNDGDAPDAFAAKKGSPGGVTKTLEKLIDKKLSLLQQNNTSLEIREKARAFLKSFHKKVIDYLVETHDDNPERLEQLNASPQLRFLFEGEYKQRIDVFLAVNHIRQLAYDKSITRSTLFVAIGHLENIIRKHKTMRAPTWGESIKA